VIGLRLKRSGEPIPLRVRDPTGSRTGSLALQRGSRAARADHGRGQAARAPRAES